ncbi:hypothetical protein ACRQ5Q_14980 [Bradyrhizobium sp. PMVTL-01]|uniref:hypothetical protein n=1 Tax=Bradyrhizobium sp. PMVTL-01 TaxID=3434999 RepID=UPI003F712CB3
MDKLAILKDEKNGLYVIEVNDKAVGKVSTGDWSRAIANPVRINVQRFDFARPGDQS